MDYIYRRLSQELGRKRDKTSRDYAAAQERIYIYLTRIVASEFWWRLRCRKQNGQAAKICNAKNAGDTVTQLNNTARTAFPDQNRLNAYNTLVEKLNTIRLARNDITHNDGLRLDTDELQLVNKSEEVLKEINKLLNSGDYPVGPSREWTPMIPVGRRGRQMICMCYRAWRNDLTDEIEYGWNEELVNQEPEFCRDGIHSKTNMQEGRLYFYKKPPSDTFAAPPEVCCAYPFVQVEWDFDRENLKRIWMFDSVKIASNGYCKGTDILAADRGGQADFAYIRELAENRQPNNNIYLMDPDVDGRGNAFPIRNVYRANYPEWKDNASASNTIAKAKRYLEEAAAVVYVFGMGGIGKTATVQHMLEQEFYKTGKKGPVYDYIIFLSAKQWEWKEHGMSEVDYGGGCQFFQDMHTMRKCLNNIFGDSGQLPATLAEDEAWYSGKSILLVLDDMESVRTAKWQPIMDYLEQHFTQTAGEKKRQVIITCRNMPMEGYAANVKQAAMNESDSAEFAIFCADIMGDGREKSYRQALGEGSDANLLNVIQAKNRKRLIALTQGLPLNIRVLVFGLKNAELSQCNSSGPELLEYLYKDTYKYLSSDEQRKLAFIAALLTGKSEFCAMNRLQFVWNYEEHSGNCSIEEMLQNLRDYGVLSTAGDEKSFSFPLENMRRYIERGYASETAEKREQILPKKSQRLAAWLSQHHGCSIEQCLMLQLKDTVNKWYEQQDSNDSEAREDVQTEAALQKEKDLLEDMLLLHGTIQRAAGRESYLVRAAMQMLIQVYRDGSDSMSPLFDAIYDGSDQFFAEFFRGQMKQQAERLDKEISRVGQYMLVKHLNAIRQHSNGENRNTLLILWNTMLLIRDIRNAGGQFIPELAVVLNEAFKGTNTMIDDISDADRRVFLAQMEKTIGLFEGPAGRPRKAIQDMKNRCFRLKEAFARPSCKNCEDIFFVSPL